MADKKNNEPGMDDSQAQHDRHGWDTDVATLTGKQGTMALGAGAGPEVGLGYDNDPMGEEYSAVTYGASEPGPPSGSMGKGGSGASPSELSERTTTAGNTVASAPQNYSKGGKQE